MKTSVHVDYGQTSTISTISEGEISIMRQVDGGLIINVVEDGKAIKEFYFNPGSWRSYRVFRTEVTNATSTD